MMIDTSAARRQMVRQQVRTADVFDAAILAVLDDLPRHDFVPERYAALAYADTEIPLGNARYMMTPIVEGRLLQSLDVGPDDRVLEIGTGAGFLTACLARLAASVVSLDTVLTFSESAAKKLAELGITNAEVLTRDSLMDLPDERFDAIAVAGSLTEIDDRLIAALNPGGRLFVVVGEPPVMEACLVTRSKDGGTTRNAVFETCLPPMVETRKDPVFSF